MSDLNKIVSVKTHYEYDMACNECDMVLDPESCDGCSGVLFERTDYQEGNEIIHLETKKDHLHFCSKECAEEWLEKYKKEVQEK